MSLISQGINGRTKIVGVFGFPVEHSLSPQMHNAAFRFQNLNFIYLPFEVKPQKLKYVLENLPYMGIKGVNLTVPHKEIAYNYVDVLSKEAKLIKAVNTIKVINNKLYGYNTDGSGFIKSLNSAKINIKNKNVIVLGAGGASRGISITLSLAGIRSLVIANRTYEKAQKLVNKISKLSEIKVFAIPLEENYIKEIITDMDILINATSVGLNKGDEPIISSKSLHPKLFVYDLIYSPSETPLMKEARKSGARTTNGISMLLYQGALAYEIWTGKPAPIKIMRNSLLKAMKSR